MWTHGYLSYILGYNPILFETMFCLNYSSFGHQGSFPLASESLRCTSVFFFVLFFFGFLSTSLVTGTTGGYRLIMCTFCLCPRISHFLQGVHEILIKLLCVYVCGMQCPKHRVREMVLSCRSESNTVHPPFITDLKGQLKELMCTQYLKRFLAHSKNSINISYYIIGCNIDSPNSCQPVLLKVVARALAMRANI